MHRHLVAKLLLGDINRYYRGDLTVSLARSASMVKYTDYPSAEGLGPPTIVQDITLNNLMVTFR